MYRSVWAGCIRQDAPAAVFYCYESTSYANVLNHLVWFLLVSVQFSGGVGTLSDMRARKETNAMDRRTLLRLLGGAAALAGSAVPALAETRLVKAPAKPHRVVLDPGHGG